MRWLTKKKERTFWDFYAVMASDIIDFEMQLEELKREMEILNNAVEHITTKLLSQ